ncbi:casein kinase I RAG8, partial [Podospora fimiseda]
MFQNFDLSALVDSPYQVGNVLTLRQTEQSELLRVKIKKLQQPWTLSCCMVVDVLSDSPDKAEETAFLKLYDWRFAAQQRSDQGLDPWTEQSASDYAKFVLSGDADTFLQQLKRPDDQWGQYQETDENWDAVQDEVFLVHEARNMYRNETTVYKRLGPLQGTTVPRLIDAVELDIGPTNLDDENKKDLFKVQGILIEYISDGFTLRHIGSMVPAEALQGIVDQAVDIARSLGDHNVLNADVRIDNFIVTQTHESDQKYRVVMI